MRIKAIVAGAAIALAATIGTASADEQFSILEGVTAVPISSGELDTVVGKTIHFTTPSQNIGHPKGGKQEAGRHLVNWKKNNLGKGQALPGSGPGYSGLCGAALRSPALTIPGQNTTTGIGGGC